MKKNLLILVSAIFLISCSHNNRIATARNEIFRTEKEFAAMASEKGIAEAFYHFAAENAVIKRNGDSLLTGRENIRSYYSRKVYKDVKLTWAPDYVDVSECGTMGYTYGRYLYSIQDSSGKVKEFRGIFHTVWKKQNNEWRYVWD